MNVTKPEKEKLLQKRNVIYAVIIAVCIFAVGLAIFQFFADEKLEVILGLAKSETEETDMLKSEFNGIFVNQLKGTEQVQNISKIEPNKDLVYTSYEKKENSLNDYDLNVNIPYININNDAAKRYNEMLKRVFQIKTEQILGTKNTNTIYTVDYMAVIEDDVLSVAIKANLKEGNSAQRLIIQTFNYDLKSNREIAVVDFIKEKGLDSNSVEAKIRSEIEKQQTQAEAMQNVGYNMLSRDINDNMYKLENTTEFFNYKGHLYLIYAYGNQKNTTTTDMVII